MEENVWVDTGLRAHYRAITDGDIQQVIPKGVGSLVDWIKAVVKFVYLGSGTSFSYKCNSEHPR